MTIAQWGYDPWGDYVAYPAPVLPIDEVGFQVIFSDQLLPEASRNGVDLPLLGLSDTAGVTGFAGETAQGGPEKNGGDEVVETINHNPEVAAPANKTIPTRTPFRLRGQGSDADGDDLVYLWEQNDEGTGGGTALTNNQKRNGPLFRVFGTAADVSEEGTLKSPSPGLNQAGTRPLREFPDLGQVLAGTTNARTGTCPDTPASGAISDKARACYSEFLPTEDYNNKLHFRLTARDNSPYGGGTAHDDVVLNVDKSAGPFLVKSLNRFQSVQRGTWRQIRWDVSGTRKYAGNVRIRLSTVNGYRWNYTLKSKTPNDGVAWVKIPRHKTKYARIIVEAKGNYFFDTNDAKFQIRR